MDKLQTANESASSKNPHHLYVRLDSYNWTGNLSGVLYVSWKNKADLKTWLRSTYLLCPKLLSRYICQDLVEIYAALYLGKNASPVSCRVIGRHLTRKEYLAETRKSLKKTEA